MQPTFTPLPEIQKMLTFSPIKTYRLYAQLRLEGKLRAEIDWIRRDNTTCIDVSRFFVELEAKGYKNFLKPEFQEMKSIDITLQESEINRNQMQSNDIERNHLPTSVDENTPKNYAEVKSDEIERHQVISDDSKSHQVKSDEIEELSPSATREMSETLKTKDEVITILKEGIERAEREAHHLREANKDLAKQNDQLTKLSTEQNKQLKSLTFLLVSPRQTRNTDDSPRWQETSSQTPDTPDNIREAEFSDARDPTDDAADVISSSNEHP
jgi:hypothetical protein